MHRRIWTKDKSSIVSFEQDGGFIMPADMTASVKGGGGGEEGDGGGGGRERGATGEGGGGRGRGGEEEL